VTAAIDARDVTYAFGEGALRTEVLHGVSLTVGRGEVVVLKGASGSGKTTLLSLLACLRSLQGGAVTLLGQPLHGTTPEQRVALRRQLGFIFQAHNLHPALTALQNVRLGLEQQGPSALVGWKDRATHTLDLFGLSERLDFLPGQLSGGQRQRVAIARALVGNPQVVFADEPTAALDAASGSRVMEVLRKLADARGTTSLIVTHDARIMQMADRVVTLADGALVEDVRRSVPEVPAEA
jgi:putative ABC transport system ATP-binding protein